MFFGPLPSETNLYIVNFLLIFSYIIYAVFAMMLKGKYYIGVRYTGSFFEMDEELRQYL